MADEALVTVGVLSTRPGLDLAINTWMRGYQARSSVRLSEVLDLAGNDGIVVVDLVDTDRREQLQALADLGLETPVVAVVPASGWPGGPFPGDPIVVTAPSDTAPLADALNLARQQLAVPAARCPSGADGGRAGSSDAEARAARRDSTRWWSRGGVRQGSVAVEEPVVERVIDLTDPPAAAVPEPARVTAPSSATGDNGAAARRTVEEIDAGSVLRGWALLTELEHHLGSASAVVGVRTTAGAHAIVAAVDIASYEAEQSMPGGHPLLDQLSAGPGWLLRPIGRQDAWADVPLRECEHLLLVALPGEGGGLDGVLAVGHFRSIDERSATSLAAAAADHDGLRRRLELHLGAATPVDLDDLLAGGTSLQASAVGRGWNLLGALYPHLRGRAVVVSRTSSGDLVTTAGQHVSAREAVRVVHRDHALLQRMAATGGSVVDVSQPSTTELFRGLPLPTASAIGAFPVGDPAAPQALVLLARPEPIPVTHQARVATAIATWQS